MPTLVSPVAPAGAARCGARLAVDVGAGEHVDSIAIEPGHCERLFRLARYLAIRDGHLAAGAAALARVVPARVRDRHGDIDCLESFAVELIDEAGRVASRREFDADVWSAFATARGVHLLDAAGNDADASTIVYALHASAGEGAPLPVEIPVLPAMSLAALEKGATAFGRPDDGWSATFVRPSVVAGLDEMERRSRGAGVETAGRVSTRLGFDPARRRFVRVLERLVISAATEATASTVVSTAASWGEFLAEGGDAGPRAPSSVHTHLHLEDRHDGGAPQGARPVISIDDLVTHYTTFPDPLSGMLILSLFADGRVLSLYGYTTGGRLGSEAGYRVTAE